MTSGSTAVVIDGDNEAANQEDTVVQAPASPVLVEPSNTLLLASALLSLGGIVLWVAGAFGGVVSSVITLKDSSADVVLTVHIPLSVFLLYASKFKKGTDEEKLSVFDAGQYIAGLTLLMATSKPWVFRGWKTTPLDGIICLFSIAASIAHLILFVSTMRASSTEKASLRWESAKIILRPYFVPQGYRNKVFVAMTWVVLVIAKVCTVSAPIVLGTIVSRLTQPNPDPSFHLIALFCALTLAPNVLSEIQDSLYVKVFQTAYAEVAEATFRHVHTLSVEWHLQKKIGNVVRSLDRGMEGADSLMYNTMLFFFPAVVSALVSFIVVAVHFQRPDIAGVCFLGFGFYCWVTLTVTVWRQKFRQEMNAQDNDMHDKASDSLINFEAVKCFTNEEHEVASYIKSVREYQAHSFNTQASTSLMNVSQSATIQLAMLGSLMLAAYAVANHEAGFNSGQFVAVQAYVLSIFQPLSYLGIVYNSMMNSVTDLQNLSDLLAAAPDVVDAPDAVPLVVHNSKKGASIEFKDVSFHYPTSSPSLGLKKVSFTVPAGTTTAIVGPTGSGKTTISRLLFRFYDVIGGAVLIDGKDIRECTQKSVRHLIGVVPQDTVMFNETVRYNIRYGRMDATDAEVEEAAKKAQVHDFVMRFDQQYDSICGERGLKLSGGEKQRIAIARCLLKDPLIVLLDEATSALDNKTEKEVQQVLKCLEGRTTLVIAHRLTTVRNADQIIVMKNGEVAEVGSHDQLLERNGLYAEMWNSQLTPTTAATPPQTPTPSTSPQLPSDPKGIVE